MTFPNKNGAAAQQTAQAQVNRKESGTSTDARNGAQAITTSKTTGATSSTTINKKNSTTQNIGEASATPALAPTINKQPSATD